MINPPLKFQVRGVRFLENAGGRAILGDDMGVGKTYQTIAWMAINPDERPAVIVVPGSVKYNWQREFRIHAGMDSQVLEAHKAFSLSYRLQDEKSGEWGQERGKTFNSGEKRRHWVKQYGKRIEVLGQFRENHPPIESEIVILNYEILQDWISVLMEWGPRTLVMDECQYVKEMKAGRTKLCRKLARETENVIPLSGTPIVNRPAEFFPVLNMIDPVEFDSFWTYGWEYCAPEKGFGGYTYKGASNLDALHKRIRPYMIRRMKKDVLKDLPPKLQNVVPVQISNRKEYRKAQDNFLKWLLETEGMEKMTKAMRAQVLVKIGKMKALSAKGKMATAVKWISDWLADTDQKIVVFAIHKSIARELKKKFPDAAMIVGNVAMKDRQAEVDRFQEDPKCRVFIGNIRAAGVGITLTASSTVLFLELGWTPAEHEQAEDRVLRIGQVAAGVNIHYLLGIDTIDEDIWELLAAKKDIVSRILDGKEAPSVSIHELLFKQAKKGA
jgi:SWI/SNF-related matrix-associated actin-dependent regulator 1 of chromatin subfamily A